MDSASNNSPRVVKSCWEAAHDELDDEISASPTKTLRKTIRYASPTKTIRYAPSMNTSHSPSKVVRNCWEAAYEELENEMNEGAFNPKAMYGTVKTTRGRSLINSFKHKASLKASSALALSTINVETDCDRDFYADDDDDGISLETQQLREEERFRDTVDELMDLTCGNPTSADAHDERMRPLFTSRYPELPPDTEVRHMHVLDRVKYMNPNDLVIEHAKPRLCDGVATILHETAVKCLDDFLSSHVKVFEWRRYFTKRAGGQSVRVIRREGNRVVAGMYVNQGFTYLWRYFVKSVISYNGKWSEIHADEHATTRVTPTGPDWDNFEVRGSKAKKEGDYEEPIDSTDINHPSNPLFALSAGRNLAAWWLDNSGESYNWMAYNGAKVEWSADGVVTEGKIKTK